MSTSDLQSCLTGQDGARSCNPISTNDALKLAWHHGWIWWGLAPFLLLFIPLLYRAISWSVDRRET